jgi:hypothetical protein
MLACSVLPLTWQAEINKFQSDQFNLIKPQSSHLNRDVDQFYPVKPQLSHLYPELDQFFSEIDQFHPAKFETSVKQPFNIDVAR